MPKLTRKRVILYLLIVVILYMIIAVIPKMTNALTSTEIVQEEKLRVEDEVTGYIVRDETVYTAPDDGDMDFLLKEGDLIRTGTKVLDFKVREKDEEEQNSIVQQTSVSKYQNLLDSLGQAVVTDETFKSARKGIFSFYVDGAENYFTPSHIDELTESDAKTHSSRNMENLERKRTIKGDPIYKIADNCAWYIVCWIDEESKDRYTKGGTVRCIIDGNEVKATVKEIKKQKKKYRLTLKTNRYCRGMEKMRQVEASVISFESTGLLISNIALAEKDGQIGVYVKNTTDDYIFTPVQRLATDGDKTLVTEGTYYDEKGIGINTVKIYDEILRHPDHKYKENKE